MPLPLVLRPTGTRRFPRNSFADGEIGSFYRSQYHSEMAPPGERGRLASPGNAALSWFCLTVSGYTPQGKIEKQQEKLVAFSSLRVVTQWPGQLCGAGITNKESPADPPAPQVVNRVGAEQKKGERCPTPCGGCAPPKADPRHAVKKRHGGVFKGWTQGHLLALEFLCFTWGVNGEDRFSLGAAGGDLL